MGPLTPMVHFIRRCRLAAFLSALFLPGIVSAREIIVAPSGGDFATIAAGVSAAQAGDSVTVRAGIYNGAVSFGRSGSAAAYITLHGESGARLRIIGSVAPTPTPYSPRTRNSRREHPQPL